MTRVICAVGIHENYDFSPGGGQTPGTGATIARSGFIDDLGAKIFGDCCRAILRAAVDEDDFEEQIFIDGVQDMRQAVFFVEGGYDEGCVHDKL